MTNDTILTHYQVRKSNPQKTAFIDYLKNRLAKAGYDPELDITIQEKWKGIFKTRNIIVGNPEQADIFFTAHYDTCALCPFPNLMAPTNLFIYIAYQILLFIMIFAMMLIGTVAVALLTNNALDASLVALIILYGFLFQLMFGYRNKHTANDNTSGVITITRILEELSSEQRSKVCVVYFDNEEKGLFGSEFFNKTYQKFVKDKLLINFDCVGDGNNIATLAKKKAMKDPNYIKFCEVLQTEAEHTSLTCQNQKVKPMMFPSDQMHFQKGIGVCALRKSPIGLYCARIHTPFDTKCEAENIHFLYKSMIKFVEQI